jgi:hyperosmotically inducible protein
MLIALCDPEIEQPRQCRAASHRVLTEVMQPMVRAAFRRISILTTSVLLASTIAFVGCGHGHPDDQAAVYSSLGKNDLRSVTVSQDRDKGTITLKGIVASPTEKQKAEQVARQAAPGYSIVDRMEVKNLGLQGELKAAQKDARLDSAIEDHYKDTIEAHRDLKNIKYSAYNQTLTLRGSVKTYKEREEAEDLARKVPQVQKVVNEIQIQNGNKPSPDNS